MNDLYFKWLCNKVCDEDDFNAYKDLLMCLYTIPFKVSPLAPMDENRINDCYTLRDEFFMWNPEMNKNTDLGEISVLEVIIELCRRMLYILDGYLLTENVLFYELMDNLNVLNDRNIDLIRLKVEMFIARQYDSNGNGGLFPLQNPTKNQRYVELWYQMQAYLDENYPL